MTILVCGATGQLGRALVSTLDDQPVIALGSAELDITDLNAVRAALAERTLSVVVNCAAYTRVDDAETDHAGAYLVNALGARNLAVATAEVGITLMHVSTDYVFDGSADRAYHEYDEPCPASVYGASKLAGERAVASLNPRHYIVRTAWLYGDNGNNFPDTMLKLADRAEVRVVDDQVGSPTYAPHLAVAMLSLLESQSFGIWHLAGSGSTSWHGLTCALYAATNISTPVIPVTTAEFPRPAARPACSILESMQSPAIKLPQWQQGLTEFIAARA